MRLTAAVAATCVSATFAVAEPAHAIVRHYELNIPEQRLDAALTDLAQQTGLLIARFSDTVADGGLVGPISGTRTVEDALRTLLADSGLTFKVVSERTIAVVDPKEMPQSSASQSQTSTPVDVTDTEEIIVAARRKAYITSETSATKSGAPLVATPQAITVVNRDQMDAQNVQSVAEALRYTAGVVAEARGTNSRFDSVFLRGFGGVGRNAVYVQNLDGLRLLRGISYTIPQIEQYGLERIDILKGPSSVLYGQASPGGLINLTSKKPTATRWNEIEVEGGNYDRRKVAAGFSGPLAADGQLLYRVDGLWLDTQTQVDSTEQERMFIAPSLTWNIAADTSLTLLTRYQDDPSSGAYAAVPAAGTIRPNVNGSIASRLNTGEPDYDTFERTLWSVGYLFTHRFNEAVTLRQNVRYMNMETDARLIEVTGLRADQHTLERGVTTSLERLDAFSIDNQLHIRFVTGALEHTLLFGVDYQHGEADRLLATGPAATLDLFAPVYQGGVPSPPPLNDLTQTQAQLGFYAQEQIELGNWNLQLGVRHDTADLKILTRNTGATTRQSDEAFTGRVGLLYLFDNGLAPYASYSTSFEPLGGADFSGKTFEPTEGEQIEVGVKYEPLRFPALFTFSAFELTQQNVSTADLAHPGFSVQTGEVRSRGIELESHTRMGDRLNLVASYALLDTKVTRSNTNTLGKWPIVVPRHMASLWADYDVGTGLGVGVGARYTGGSFGDTQNTLRVPSYMLYDAVVHYDFGAADDGGGATGWRLALNANNLFDKEYISTCYASYACFFGVRRTLTASMRYRF